MNIFVIGGGAAGFFSALAAKASNPNANVVIIEKTAKFLSKVKVSGGGRCNVTHHCFDPKELMSYYPRGYRELLGPMHRFGPTDTIEWFKARGVSLKVEKDGRMFPITDSSQTIIDCFTKEAELLGVKLWSLAKLNQISQTDNGFFLELSDGQSFTADRVILATGSSSVGHRWAKSLGHTIVDPVPSLFTFNIPSSPLKELSGVSVPLAKVSIENEKLNQEGPLLITHFGLSGPAVLKLSAFAAKSLNTCGYNFTVSVNWLGNQTVESAAKILIEYKQKNPQATIQKLNPFLLPKKLWIALIQLSAIKIDSSGRVGSISDKDLKILSSVLTELKLNVKGKTTHKEEFVTCGGIQLKEVSFKSMESRLVPHLYFAGEILDIDGVTGGFNFQNAWTTGYIAGQSAAY